MSSSRTQDPAATPAGDAYLAAVEAFTVATAAAHAAIEAEREAAGSSAGPPAVYVPPGPVELDLARLRFDVQAQRTHRVEANIRLTCPACRNVWDVTVFADELGKEKTCTACGHKWVEENK
jgi:hypothetical protein